MDIATHDLFFLYFRGLGLALASSTLTGLGLVLAGLGHVAGVPVPVVLPFGLLFLYFSLLFLYIRFTKILQYKIQFKYNFTLHFIVLAMKVV